MTTDEVLDTLKSLGSEQTRKTYINHGVGENCHGVSYGDMEKLRKRIKTDHALALELWKSGQHEARVLATMIADPARLDAQTLDAWAGDIDNHVMVDAMAGIAAKSPAAREKMEEWIIRDDEQVGRAGWRMLADLAMGDASLPDEYFEPYLATIAGEIHAAKNRVREAMNGALIAIGIRSEGPRASALDVAARIGKVKVDHGKTSCKTPDAAEYIMKTVERRKSAKPKKVSAGV